MLPLDEERLVEAHVGAAFQARAAVSTTSAEVLRGGAGWATEFLLTRIEDGRRTGQVAPSRDAEREARILLALVDGLTAHILVGHHSPAVAEETLDGYLADLFAHGRDA